MTLAFAGVTGALAHAELTSSTPAAGEVLNEPPTEVKLTFSEPIEVRFSTLKVYPLEADIDFGAADATARLNGLAGQLVSEALEAQGDDEARVDTGVSTAERTAQTITLPLKSDLESGVYVVMWRVLSVDSHETQGFLTFQVAP